MSGKKRKAGVFTDLAASNAAADATQARVRENPFLKATREQLEPPKTRRQKEEEARQPAVTPTPEAPASVPVPPPIDLDSRRPQKASAVDPIPVPEAVEPPPPVQAAEVVEPASAEPVPEEPKDARPARSAEEPAPRVPTPPRPAKRPRAGRPPKHDVNTLFYDVPVTPADAVRLTVSFTREEKERLKAVAHHLRHKHWRQGRADPVALIRAFFDMWIAEGCPALDHEAAAVLARDKKPTQIKVSQEQADAVHEYVQRHAMEFSWVEPTTVVRCIVLAGMQSKLFGEIEAQLKKAAPQ